MDASVLEKVYKERLEERIIAFLAKEHSLSLEKAMDVYYKSRMAEMIHKGEEGIQYLDCKLLAQILYETEPELFV